MPETERRMAALQALGVALSAAASEEEVARAVAEHIVDAVDGCRSSAVAMVRPDSLELVAARGLPEDAPAKFKRVALDANLAMLDAIRTRKPVLRDRQSLIASFMDDVAAVAAIPLISGDACFGALSLGFRDAHAFDEPSRENILTFARICAQSLDRVRQHAAARREAARLAILVEAARLFAASDTTLDEVIGKVAQKFAEVVGDSCAVWLLSDDRQISRPVALRHRTAEIDAFARQVLNLRACPVKESPVARVLAAQGPVRLHSAEIAALRQRNAPEDPRAPRWSPHAMAAVPLRSDGEIVGAVFMSRTVSLEPYDDDDVALITALADHAGLAYARAQLQARERTLLAETRAAVELRDQFVSIASHELKTPVATLLLQLEGLRRALRKTGEVAGPWPERIDRQTRRLARLVDDLLDVSRIQSGRVVLDLEECDLRELTEEVIARLREQTPTSITVSASGPIVGRWDRSRLDQVLTNLLVNATKYGNSTPIEVGLAIVGKRARIRVHDQGPGISPDDQKRIFGPFERGSTVAQGGGFGLGLFIVRNLVEAHGGSVHVDSGNGAGTSFVVELPLTP